PRAAWPATPAASHLLPQRWRCARPGGRPAVVPDGVQPDRRGRPGERPHQRRAGDERHQREQLQHRDRLATGAGRQPGRPPPQPRTHVPQRRHDVPGQDPYDLQRMQQTSARDGEKRRRHEDLVGGRVEDGAGARFAEPTRQHPVEEIRCGRRAHEREPGNRLFITSEGEVRISRTIPGSGEEALAVLKPGACFGEMAIFDRSERSTDAIANTSCTLITIARSDFELLLDFNRDIAYKVLWSVVRLLSARLRITNDNLRSFLAMSMF